MQRLCLNGLLMVIELIFNLSSLIVDYRILFSRIPQVKLLHCFHETNKYADALARKWPFSQKDFMIFDSSLVNISILLYYDSIGMYYERIRRQTSLSG